MRTAPGIPASDIRAAAGVDTGDPLLLLDLGEVEARIEAVPAVREAHVSRDIPDELRINVVPRVPAAWARRDAEHVAVVDETGTVIADVAEPPEDLPEIRGVTRLAGAGQAVGARRGDARARGASRASSASRWRTVVVLGGVVALQLTDGSRSGWGRRATSKPRRVPLGGAATRSGAPRSRTSTCASRRLRSPDERPKSWTTN